MAWLAAARSIPAPASECRVAVVGIDGRPLAGAEVAVEPVRRCGHDGCVGVSFRGRLRWQPAPAMLQGRPDYRVVVHARAPGHPWHTEGPLALTDLTVHIQPGVPVVGTVVGELDGAGWIAIFTRPSPYTWPQVLVPFDGRSFRTQDLSLGSWQLRLWGPDSGDLFERRQVEIRAEGNELLLPAPRGGPGRSPD